MRAFDQEMDVRLIHAGARQNDPNPTGNGTGRLAAPETLLRELPLTGEALTTVQTARAAVSDVINRRDDRLLVIVGPCSIHDPDAAIDYASRLADLRRSLSDDLLIVMRAYFEKPRTTTGWKGLINDPYLDGSHAMADGLRIARRLLLDLNAIGMPAACEFLDTFTHHFLQDAVAWAAIGARTVESPIHRQLASGLRLPVGFKNATDGSVQPAIDACRVAAISHVYLDIAPDGRAAVVSSAGNPDCHLVLRGGRGGPNYQEPHLVSAVAALEKSGLSPRLVIDASHGNSGKDHRRQPLVAGAIGERIAAGDVPVVGVMLESFLVEGRQQPGGRVYGRSITDACLGFEQTADVLADLAGSVRKRRANQG